MNKQFTQQPHRQSLPSWLMQAEFANSFWDGQLLVDPEPKDTSDTPDTKSGGDASDTKDNKSGEDTSDTPDTKDTKGGEDTSDTKDTKGGEDTSDTKGGENPISSKEIIEALSALFAKREPDAKDTSDTSDTKDGEDTSDTKDTKSSEGTPEVDEVTQKAVRNLIIQQNNVPSELHSILPENLGQLSEFLQSENYQKLAQALQPKPKDEPKPSDPKDEPSGSDLDKAKPKTFGDITPEMLSAFDKLW